MKPMINASCSFREIEHTLQPKLQSALLDSARATEEINANLNETIIREVMSDEYT